MQFAQIGKRMYLSFWLLHPDAPTNQKKSQLHFFSWKSMLLHWKWCIFLKNLNLLHKGLYSHKSNDWRSATSNSKEVPIYCGILEHWNSQKSLTSIWQHFSCWLDEGIAKICKRKFFTMAFWDNPHYPFWDAHGQAG